MLLFLLLLIIAVIGILLWLSGYHGHIASNARYYCGSDLGKSVCGAIMSICCGLGLIASVIGVSASSYSSQNDARSFIKRMQIQMTQRDQMISVVRKELSTQDLTALYNSFTKADVLLVLNNGAVQSAVDFITTRADRIIAYNSEIFKLRNEALDAQIDICNTRDNPWIPQLPFHILVADCTLDLPGVLTDEPTISTQG